jgi:DNA-binding NtrC family response regulator
MNSKVLFITPHDQDADSLTKMLAGSRPIVHARSLKEAAGKLSASDFGVVLTEANLEDGTWLDVVTEAWADARFCAKAINLGAFDLVVQPFRAVEVSRVLASACAQRQMVKAAAVAALAV